MIRFRKYALLAALLVLALLAYLAYRVQSSHPPVTKRGEERKLEKVGWVRGLVCLRATGNL